MLNYGKDKLVSASKISVGEEEACDVCSSDEPRLNEATVQAKLATKHCLQCQQNYCDQYSWSHTKIKPLANHVMIQIGKELQKEEIALRLLPTTYETPKVRR